MERDRIDRIDQRVTLSGPGKSERGLAVVDRE